MTLYAESSAVLAWLLGEPDGEAVRKELAGADSIVTSDLTLVECDRVLRRAVATGLRPEAEAASRRARLARAATAWHRLHMSAEVVDRARGGFPVEPVRSLDALHLASALVTTAFTPGVAILSLDARIRENATALGFEVRP